MLPCYPNKELLPLMQHYALIVGHGRSGTNWLLDIFDASPFTFCRNEPNEVTKSPCQKLKSIWQVEETMEDMDRSWDSIAALMGQRMGERDHRIENPKVFVHPLSQRLGVTSLPARPRVRAALRVILPSMRAGQWPMPWWVGRQSTLQKAYALLKINQAARVASWVLANRPNVPVIHIVRHPSGRLNSWLNRFLEKKEEAQIDQRNKARLQEVLSVSPEWADRFGDIDAMSIAESETWFWRYVTESIHQAGKGLSHYKLVIYEDLALRPLAVARQVYDFCGLPFTEEVEAIILQGMGESVWGKIQGTSATVAQAWRSKLTADEIATVNKVLDGSLMETWWQRAYAGSVQLPYPTVR